MVVMRLLMSTMRAATCSYLPRRHRELWLRARSEPKNSCCMSGVQLLDYLDVLLVHHATIVWCAKTFSAQQPAYPSRKTRVWLCVADLNLRLNLVFHIYHLMNENLIMS